VHQLAHQVIVAKLLFIVIIIGSLAIVSRADTQ